MLENPYILVYLGAYILLSRFALSYFPSPVRQIVFAIFNVLTLALIYDWGAHDSFLIMYIVLVILEYLLLMKAAESVSAYRWAIFLPILSLFIIKYVPETTQKILSMPGGLVFKMPLPVYFVGISFMAFRLSQMAVELRTSAVKKPDFWKYLSYAFFVPIIPIGPISAFKTFSGSFDNPSSEATPWKTSLSRILVGAVKYFFLGTLFNELAFNGLMLDNNLHHLIDLPIAGVGYYLFLYFNFSGFCDMAIGAAGLMGISVEENFNNPLLARNLQDFWGRWHITLGSYMRQMVFVPLSKSLVMRFGQASLNFCIGVTIFVVFILIGIWHGNAIQYVLFGLVHAVGVLAGFLYGNWLKKKLGRERYGAYMSNPWILNVARVATFVYVSFSMAVFANEPAVLYRLTQLLTW